MATIADDLGFEPLPASSDLGFEPSQDAQGADLGFEPLIQPEPVTAPVLPPQADVQTVAVPQKSSALRRALDPLVALGQGVVDVGQAVVGGANLPTLGLAGKAFEAIGGSFPETQTALESLLSPAQQEANRRVNEAKGILPTIQATLENPSTISQSVVRSLPSMGAGGAVARRLLGAAVKTASPAQRLAAAAAGEGTVAGSQSAEQIRQQTPGGTLSPLQAMIAAGSGAATMLLTILGGRAANSALGRRLGIADIDQMMAGATTPEAKKGFASMVAKVVATAVSEGFIEELGQSALDQAAQNIALGKPWHEGVAEAAIQGMFAGGLMGAVAAMLPGKKGAQNAIDTQQEQIRLQEERARVDAQRKAAEASARDQLQRAAQGQQGAPATQRAAPIADTIPLAVVPGEANLGEVNPPAVRGAAIAGEPHKLAPPGVTPGPATIPAETRDEQAARIRQEVAEAERLRAQEAQKNLPQKETGVIDTIAGRMGLTEFEKKGYAPEQVTKQDWVNLQRAERRRLGQPEGGDNRNAPWVEYENFHEDAVRRALSKGEEVDPEVLKDYPNLKPSPVKESLTVEPVVSSPKEPRVFYDDAVKAYTAVVFDERWGNMNGTGSTPELAVASLNDHIAAANKHGTWRSVNHPKPPVPATPELAAEKPAKPPELMSPSEFSAETGIKGKAKIKAGHAMSFVNPRAARQPLNAESVDTYGIKLPEGYVREGDNYVFKPAAPTAAPPSPPAPEVKAEFKALKTRDQLVRKETEDAIAALEEQSKDIKRRRKEVRAQFKGQKPISTMNRTTPKIERGQQFQRALDVLDVEEHGIASMWAKYKKTLSELPEPPTPEGTVRESKGEEVETPISEQDATRAVVEKLGVKELPSNIVFVENLGDLKGRVTYSKGQLPQIEISLAHHDTADSVKDTLVHELLHPTQDDPAMASAVRSVADLVQETDRARKSAIKYDANETTVEATNELIRKFFQEHANSNIFQRAVTQVVIAAKRLFRLTLTARQAAVFLVQDAVKNHVAASSGEGLSREETQVIGEKVEIKGKPGMASREELESHALSVLKAAGFKDIERRTYTAPGNRFQSIFWLPRTGFNMDAEGNKLAELLKVDLERQRTAEEKPLGGLIAAIGENWKSPDSAFMDMSETVRNRLLQVSQSEASERGAALGELSMFSHDISNVGLHADVYLTKDYSKKLGGEKLRGFLGRILTEFRSLFTDKEMDDALDTAEGGELGSLIEQLIRMNVRDAGSRVYRAVHAEFKPKRSKSQAAKERTAKENEAITAMIEQAVALEIPEPATPPNQKLTPEQRLALMTTPQTQAKIQTAIERAVMEGERNAGLASMRKNPELADEVMEIESDPDAMPPSEHIEAGLDFPEYAHWRKFRDNLLHYSPTTLKLVQDVIKGNFKGVRFKDAAPKVEDLRIDMRKLAVSPNSEVEAVFQAQLDAASQIMDVVSADPIVQERVIQTIRDNLAEQLESRRREITEAFRSGKDIPLSRENVTPEERASRDAAILKKLEGLIHAGALDTQLVDSVAGKYAVQRLVPSVSDLMKQVFSVPFYRQSELKTRFASVLASKLAIDAAEAEQAWLVFEAAFDLKLNEARRRAFDKAKESLTLKERKEFGQRKLWLEIEHLANAGFLDEGSHLRAIAESRGWSPPSDEKVRQMRDWSEAEMRLRELSLEEEAAIRSEPGLSEEEIEAKLMAARDMMAARNTEERRALMQKIAARWSKWTSPTSGLKRIWTWFHDDFRRNNARAVNEFISANYLAKVFFGTRQLIDVGTGSVTGGFTRELAHGWERWANDKGNPERERNLWNDLHEAVKEGFNQRRKVFGLAINAAARTMKTGVKARNIELLQTGIMLFDRKSLEADDLQTEGKTVQALFARVFAMVELGRRVAGSMDVLQSIPVETLEIRLALTTELRSRFPAMTHGAAQIKADEILGDIATVKLEAINQAKDDLVLRGNENPSPREISVNAWHIMRERMLQAMERANMMPDDFRAELEQLRETKSWNLPEGGGPGALIGIPMRKGIQIGEEMGAPLGSFLSFGNAIAISANRAASWFGFGLFPGLFKGSPWAEGHMNQMERRVEGILGSSINFLVFMLVATGAVAFRRLWPKDDKEKERWIANGWRPDQFSVQTSDNTAINISSTVGPMAMFRPAAWAGAAVHDLIKDQQDRQKKLDDKADKLGVARSVAEGPTTTQVMGVFGSAIWGGLAGGRTAGGALSKYTDYGMPDAKRTIAGGLSGILPLTPGWQEVARALGSNIDSKLASIRELIIPIPGSGNQRLNVLGQPLRNENDAERILQIATGGTVPWPVLIERNKSVAISNYFDSGYSAPRIVPDKAYVIDGKWQPLRPSQVREYARLRGEYFETELANLGPLKGYDKAESRKEVQAAFKRANVAALERIGVDVEASKVQPERTAAPRSASEPSEAAQRTREPSTATPSIREEREPRISSGGFGMSGGSGSSSFVSMRSRSGVRSAGRARGGVRRLRGRETRPRSLRTRKVRIQRPRVTRFRTGNIRARRLRRPTYA